MERVNAQVPPPLKEQIEQFQKTEGFENHSQAVRALLRRGLNDA